MNLVAIAAGVIALVAAVSASRAAQRAHAIQKQVQLYPERRAIFDKVMAFLAQTEVDGKPHQTQEIRQLLQETQEAEHLFGPQVKTFIRRVAEAASRYHTHYGAWEGMSEGPARQKKYTEVELAEHDLHQCFLEARALFDEDLNHPLRP